MKAYLMSIPQSLRGISDKLNVESLLCKKTWILFHEEKKVSFIFQKKGSLIISQNGEASKGSWEYIKANKTILIEAMDVKRLLRPTFVDDVLFILQQDGTDTYFVLIDEKHICEFFQKTINAINDYLKELSDEERERKQKEKLEKQKIEQERRQKEESEKRKLRKLAIERSKNDIKQATETLKKKKKNILIAGGIATILFFILITLVAPVIILAIVPLIIIVLIVTTDHFDTKITKIEESIIEQQLQQIKSFNKII